MLVPKMLADPQLSKQHASQAGLCCSKQRQILRRKLQCAFFVLKACLGRKNLWGAQHLSGCCAKVSVSAHDRWPLRSLHELRKQSKDLCGVKLRDFCRACTHFTKIFEPVLVLFNSSCKSLVSGVRRGCRARSEAAPCQKSCYSWRL